MDVELPDGQVITGVPDGWNKVQLTAHLAKKGYNVEPLRQQITEADQAATRERFKAEEAARPWGEKALAVAGGTVNKTLQGLAGIPRLFGADIGPTEEDVKEHDKYREQLREITPGASVIEPLTDIAMLWAAPGAGTLGLGARVASRVLPRAAAAMRAGTPGTKGALVRTLADRAATGGLVSAATAPGDWGDRAVSGALGATGSAAPSVLGMAGRTAARAVGNRGAQAGRIVEEMGEPQARALATRLDDQTQRDVFNRAGVTRPTAAQVTDDPALQRLETGLRVKRGDLFAEADERMAEEHWRTLGNIAGNQTKLDADILARKAGGARLRDPALAAAKGQDFTSPIKQTVQTLLTGESRTNPAVRTMADWVQRELDEGVTPEQLYSLRKALTGGIPRGSDLGAAVSQARAERMAIINAIDQGLDRATGGQWTPYLQEWGRLSQPITSQQAGRGIQEAFEQTPNRTRAGTPVLTSGKLQQALEKHGEKEIGGKTFSRVTPQERETVESIARTIERAERGKQAQGMIGSRTAGNQQAAQYVDDILLGVGGGGAGAYLADEAGLGNVGGGALIALGGKRLNRTLRGRREQALASLLQDPTRLRQALLVAMRNQERGAAISGKAAVGLREAADLLPEE
jgi:hypothetical protein